MPGQGDSPSPTFRTAVDPSFSEHTHLHEFLAACRKQHPRAWCRSADLWLTYEQWSKEHQE